MSYTEFDYIPLEQQLLMDAKAQDACDLADLVLLLNGDNHSGAGETLYEYDWVADLVVNGQPESKAFTLSHTIKNDEDWFELEITDVDHPEKVETFGFGHGYEAIYYWLAEDEPDEGENYPQLPLGDYRGWTNEEHRLRVYLRSALSLQLEHDWYLSNRLNNRTWHGMFSSVMVQLAAQHPRTHEYVQTYDEACREAMATKEAELMEYLMKTFALTFEGAQESISIVARGEGQDG